MSGEGEGLRQGERERQCLFHTQSEHRFPAPSSLFTISFFSPFVLRYVCGGGWGYTPSTVFRHPPPNSARFSYATEGALFISAQLSSDAVSALRKVRVLI